MCSLLCVRRRPGLSRRPGRARPSGRAGTAARPRSRRARRRPRRRRRSARGSAPRAARPRSRPARRARRAPRRRACATRTRTLRNSARSAASQRSMLISSYSVTSYSATKTWYADVLDERGQRALPADVLAAEGQPPAVQPAGAAQRRVRRPEGHLPRVHVAAVGGVDGHEPRLGAATPPGRAPACGTMGRVTRIGIIGGGPGGYEAALVAAQLGAEVTVVDRDGLGGSAVLTDCVPSKTLIATAEVMTDTAESGELGRADRVADAGPVRARWASTWPGSTPGSPASRRRSPTTSRPGSSARACGCVRGLGRLDGPTRVVAEPTAGGAETVEVDAVLVVDRCAPAGAARRAARRRADPDLGAALHPRRAARAPRRGGLRRDRRGVRVGLHRARQRGDAGLQPRPGAARRGRRRRAGARGRVQAPRHDGAVQVQGRSGTPVGRPGASSRSTTAARSRAATA